MKKYENEITAVGSDVLIAINNESCYLSQEVEAQLDFTESVMCKTNADDVLKIAHALDSIRDDIQKWYDKWKAKEFRNNRVNG